MPTITGGVGPGITPYTPNLMLDVPGGVMVQNAAGAPGSEVYATTVSTRYVVDWATVPNPVAFTRIQVVGKNSTTGSVVAKVRDLTAGVDIATATITGTTALLVAGGWANFVIPTVATTYAVFVQGDGVMDPTLYSVLWEWR